MKCIEIRDSMNEHFLSVTIFNLLSGQMNVFKKYNWSIYELNATAQEKSDINLLELRSRIFNSSSGLKVNFDELLEIMQQLDQVIDLILVASGDEKKFTKFEDDNKWRDKYPIVIEIIDGAYWEVYSNDKELIKNLSKFYQDTKIRMS